jgi:hypothetical protein
MTIRKSILFVPRQFTQILNLDNSTAVIPPDGSETNATTATLDSKFTEAQAQEINAAMSVIFSLFGGAGKFFAVTGIANLKFVLPEKLSCAQSNAVSCYVGDGIIEMTAGAFSPAPLVSGWYIAHEVGHAFDFSRSGGKPRLYRSQAFVEYFIPKNWFQRLLGLPICKVSPNIGYQGKDWTEIAKATGASIRGQLNSAEDFADTFAVIYAVTILNSDIPYRSFNSRWRYVQVLAMIKGEI